MWYYGAEPGIKKGGYEGRKTREAHLEAFLAGYPNGEHREETEQTNHLFCLARRASEMLASKTKRGGTEATRWYSVMQGVITTPVTPVIAPLTLGQC